MTTKADRRAEAAEIWIQDYENIKHYQLKL